MDTAGVDDYVRRVRAGDVSAYAGVVRETQDRLRSHLLFMCLHSADAVDDLAQEAYMHAYKNLHQYELGTNFFAWLKTIARYRARSHTRSEAARTERERRFADAALLESEAGSEPSDVECGRIEAMRTCLEKLMPQSRDLLAGRYVKDLDSQSLAQVCSMPASTVRVALMRIREQLRRCVQSKLSAEGVGA